MPALLRAPPLMATPARAPGVQNLKCASAQSPFNARARFVDDRQFCLMQAAAARVDATD